MRFTYTKLPVPATQPSSDPYRTTLGHTLLRRPKIVLLLLALVLFACTFVQQLKEGYLSHEDQSQKALLAKGDWEGLFKLSQEGWRPVSKKPTISPSSFPAPSIDRFSNDCLESWVAEGVLCSELHGAFSNYKIDIVYTYVNGSDELLGSWREGVARHIRLGTGPAREKRAMGGGGGVRGGGMRGGLVARPGGAKAGKIGPSLDKKVMHFRDHDELRYSIRSLLTSLPTSAFSKIHLITADLPLWALPNTPHATAPLNTSLSFSSTTARIGQIPTWLDTDVLKEPNNQINMVHHTEIFIGDEKVLQSSVPSFSSLAIESRMANTQGLLEHVLYMNDDCFLMTPLSTSDIASPLFGPVFRLQQDLLVSGIAPQDESHDRDGEWPGLEHANWLLDRRFGTRKRNYLAHIAKSFSTPLLKEAQELWKDEFDATSRSRFRGLAQEFQTLFLATHYVIERHREALLWSFFVARSDSNRDGVLSIEERHSLLKDLGFDVNGDLITPVELVVPYPTRTGLATHEEANEQAGSSSPKSTEITFDSRDGYISFSPHAPKYYNKPDDPWPVPVRYVATPPPAGNSNPAACSFVIKECLGNDFVKEKKEVRTVDVFKKVAFEEKHCGDCAILALGGKSGLKGLSAFLPSASTLEKGNNDGLASELVPLGGQATTYEQFSTPPSDLKGDLRLKAMRFIQRYAYSTGTSSSRLIPLSTRGTAISSLSSLNEKMAISHNRDNFRPPATFVTLNDQTVSTRGAQDLDEVLFQFFDFQWPDPTMYENDYW